MTIGAFDGIHRGHRAVIDSVCRAAREADRVVAVVTFFPHPSVVLGRAAPFYLTSTEEKIDLLRPLDLDWLVVMNFTVETSHTRADEYISLLMAHLRMREVHAGYDFAFGYKREGTLDFLRRAGREHGFAVREVAALHNGDEPISSTGIRNRLRAGDVETAAKWLGRPFRVNGTIAGREGAALRLTLWPEHALPADGDYACQASIESARYAAVAAVRTEPLGRAVSVHLTGADGDFDGARLSLDFIKPIGER